MYVCPNCASESVRTFYEVQNVPIHDVVLIDSYGEAVNYPRANVKLGYCQDCGFVYNTLFDASLLEYDDNYEETQGFSTTFTDFHKKLSERLITKYDLHNKTIIEIGCGKGEFLALLCEKNQNYGFGFDPAFVSGRIPGETPSSITFIKDYYSEKYAHFKGDFYCCKMTLEHIPNTFEFINMIRKCIGDNLNAKVYFLLPDAEKIYNELGFWDIFYEHCSYFSLGSLSHLFLKAGFGIIEIGKEFGDQYLMIEAECQKAAKQNPNADQELKSISNAVNFFEKNVNDSINKWRELLGQYKEEGKKTVLWGAGSKGVSFLSTLGIVEEVKYAVDINPNKRGKYIAGSGQEIVEPAFLLTYKPDIVIIMNPIYTGEIRNELNKMGLDPLILPIDHMNENRS